MNNGYWEDLAVSLLTKYQEIIEKRNFKFEDYKFGVQRCYIFTSIEEERRYREACKLYDKVLKDTNKIPKRYKGFIISQLKRYKK